MSSLNPSVVTMTKSSRTCREVAVDLGSKHAKKALEVLLKMEKQRNRVRSARVFGSKGLFFADCSSDWKGSASGTPGSAVAEIIELLSLLPNLEHVTINLHQSLPFLALCFLVHAPRLKSIHLENVQLTGCLSTPESFALTRSAQWRELTLSHCRGSSILDQLLACGLPSCLEKLTISNTPLGLTRALTHKTIASLVTANSQLSSLRLWDLPNFHDSHVQTLVQSLASLDFIHLQELEFTSNMVGKASGEALARLLMDCPNRVHHLKLHLDWERCSPVIVQLLLKAQFPLKNLDLRLYGDDHNVLADAVAIVQALESKSAASSLRRLRFDMELEIEKAKENGMFMAIEDMLQSNDTLKYLVLDDGLGEFSLPDSLQAKLKLNRSGAPRLWKRHDAASHAQFVQALIHQKDDLNTLFHILSNEPTLCLGTGQGGVVRVGTTSSKIMPDTLNSIITKEKQSYLSPKRTTYMARKFIKKQMKSIFAKSA